MSGRHPNPLFIGFSFENSPGSLPLTLHPLSSADRSLTLNTARRRYHCYYTFYEEKKFYILCFRFFYQSCLFFFFPSKIGVYISQDLLVDNFPQRSWHVCASISRPTISAPNGPPFSFPRSSSESGRPLKSLISFAAFRVLYFLIRRRRSILSPSLPPRFYLSLFLELCPRVIP